eukprot:TRINITY_DN4372_c0_g1_i1.p1 TRINITY_DN4372_c0_g1~~TRINITY_DN4372_c0_g1_i1.p1  ORF type:complete len:321 (-),score=61.54 TRINITY_DN4372_c0_g1_i1:183-1145(-)
MDDLLEKIEEVLQTNKVAPNFIELIHKHRHTVNNRNRSGWTALRLCISVLDDENAARHVEVLLQVGANPHIAAIPEKGQLAPIHEACRRQMPRTVAVLLKYDPSVVRDTTDFLIQPLHYAAQLSGTDIVASLIEHGADPNATTIQGLTPLHYAARRNIVEDEDSERAVQNCKCLLERGTVLHTLTKERNNAAHYAAVVGNRRLLEYLTDVGSNLALRNSHGYTPFEKLDSWEKRIQDCKHRLRTEGHNKNDVQRVRIVFPTMSARDAEILLQGIKKMESCMWTEDMHFWYACTKPVSSPERARAQAPNTGSKWAALFSSS